MFIMFSYFVNLLPIGISRFADFLPYFSCARVVPNFNKMALTWTIQRQNLLYREKITILSFLSPLETSSHTVESYHIDIMFYAKKALRKCCNFDKFQDIKLGRFD